jgi:hypothetical protein
MPKTQEEALAQFDTKTNNDKAAAGLLREQSLAPEADPLAIESLDALAAAKSKENEEKAKAAAEAPPIVIEPKEDDNTPAPDADKAAKEAADKAEAERVAKAEELKKADEFFKETPTLPPNASPKSSEAFSAVKIKAAQEITRLQQERDAAKKQVEELNGRAGKPTEEQLAKEKELEDLRAWRAKMDIDFDPKFKEFDTKVSKAHEFIYSQLRKNPAVTEDTIKQIKEYGGPDKCNLSALFEAMKDPTLQRIVESQIADVAKVRYEKDLAITEAKKNVGEYLANREKAVTEAIGGHQKATAAELAQFATALPWFAEKTADAKADEAAKKEIEEHNQFVVETRAQMQAALQDDSPRMRATLITGVLQLFNLQREHEKLKAAHEAKSKAYDEVAAKWEKVKASGRSRLPESSAAPGAPAPQKPKQDLNERSQDALDSIAKQIMEERARTGAAT